MRRSSRVFFNTLLDSLLPPPNDYRRGGFRDDPPWADDRPPEIRRSLERAGLARQKFPEHLVTVDELPRVLSGKISKDVLRDRAKAIAEAGAD